MDIYLHDRSATFQFVLKGKLMGDWVRRLEHAWDTARSVLAGKDLVVDVSGITDADPRGLALLSRMRDSGARLTAALPPASEALLTALGVPLPHPGRSRGSSWPVRVLRVAGLCG